MFRYSLFKSPKPLQYTYIPRYYDPEKEELHERIRAAKKDAGDPIEGMKARIGKSYHERLRERNQSTRRAVRQSNTRVFVIIAVLFVLAYLFLTEYLPSIESFLE